jgi:type III secretion system FlhB-like substrate exporter
LPFANRREVILNPLLTIQAANSAYLGRPTLGQREGEPPMAILPMLSALRTKMQWHQERQRVLAEHISNSDTPNFRPRDLVKPKIRLEQRRERRRRDGVACDDEHLNQPHSSCRRRDLYPRPIADYLFQYRQWYERQKMTLQEMKEEFKQSEGDPHVKGRIRQLRQARMKRRMMAQVPKASVIITNPTHYSVALSYDRDMAAPVCVAKGIDTIALKIREVARVHDIPIVENVPLARALYATVEIDDEIPVEHYHAVAEIIGYVMRLKRGFFPQL